MNDNMEKALQERFTWERSGMFTDYNAILGYYQAKACLEHARGSSLLDMPCGDGAVTSMLAPSFSTVVGVDASSQHLAKARKALPDAEFHEALIEEFTVPAPRDAQGARNDRAPEERHRSLLSLRCHQRHG